MLVLERVNGGGSFLYSGPFSFTIKDDEFLEPLMVPCRTVPHSSAFNEPPSTGEETFQNHTRTGGFCFRENEAEPALETWRGQRRAQETWKDGWNPARCWTQAGVFRLVGGMWSERNSAVSVGVFYCLFSFLSINKNPHPVQLFRLVTVHFRLLFFRVKRLCWEEKNLLGMQDVWSWLIVQLQYLNQLWV